jgi:hypothetical protein
VINGDQQHLLLHCTGCDNITSFFEMCAIQTVWVVMGREWSHSEAVVFKICSLSHPCQLPSCVGRVESLRLPSRYTFQTDFLGSQPFRNCFNVESCPEPEINCYMGHYVQTMISDKPGVRQDEELESHLNKGQFVVESPLAGFVP